MLRAEPRTETRDHATIQLAGVVTLIEEHAHPGGPPTSRNEVRAAPINRLAIILVRMLEALRTTRVDAWEDLARHSFFNPS